MPIEAGILSKSIESAQKKVEANNFATRRNVLEFDDVMNEQRKKIYSERNQVLDGADLHETIQKMINDYFDSMVQFSAVVTSRKRVEPRRYEDKARLDYGSDSLDDFKTPDDYLKYFLSKAEKLYNDRKQKYGAGDYEPAREKNTSSKRRPPLDGSPRRNGGIKARYLPSFLRSAEPDSSIPYGELRYV